MEETKKKMQETQDELSAWKFTPDSATGKRLMAKCRQLLQENEDLGKAISSGRLAKLENELAMQKALCAEMKKNQEEMDDFVQELDTDMEGMQSTIYFLQQQLKEAKDTIANYEGKDNDQENKEEIQSETKNEDDEETENPISESDSKKEDDEKETRTRGRRKQNTPTKESPVRRGRSARGQKREAEDSETTPTKSPKGRPKRKRGNVSKAAEEEGKEEEV